MENVKYKITGNQLVITVDLTNIGTVSSTGRTILIATTRGPVRLDQYEPRPGVSFALNVMAPVVG